MNKQPELIQPAVHRDARGVLYAYPNLQLLPIVRMYAISPENEHTIRAWQGHLHERKWFWPAAGSFEVQLIALNEQGVPLAESRQSWILNASEPALLAIPGAYLNGFKALSSQSTLLVFSDFDLEASKADDLRYSLADFPWNTASHE